MFGMSGTELIIILVLALLLLGPQKLPEVAKMVGKGMREFQKATNDIRSTVESEFYKMQQEEPAPTEAKPEAHKVLELKPVPGAVASHPDTTVAAEPSLLPAQPAAEAAVAAAPVPAEEKPRS